MMTKKNIAMMTMRFLMMRSREELSHWCPLAADSKPGDAFIREYCPCPHCNKEIEIEFECDCENVKTLKMLRTEVAGYKMTQAGPGQPSRLFGFKLDAMSSKAILKRYRMDVIFGRQLYLWLVKYWFLTTQVRQ